MAVSVDVSLNYKKGQICLYRLNNWQLTKKESSRC